MEVMIYPTYDEMSRAAAQAVANVLYSKPNAVLGMATGSTPLGLYQELVRMHKEEGLDFSQVTTFNLDEYVGLRPQHEQSYHHFMHGELLQACEYSAAERVHPLRHNQQLPRILRMV